MAFIGGWSYYIKDPLVQDSMENGIQGKQKMRSLQTGGLSKQVVSKAGLTVYIWDKRDAVCTETFRVYL